MFYKIKYLFILLFLFIPINTFADSASSTVVYELKSGRILYQNSYHSKHLIASITKIMTCIIALENGDLNKEVVVGDEILKMYGTNIYLEVNEKIKLIDLLYGLMLRSGNDAAVVIAKNIAGSEEKFVELMNKKTIELGMKDSIFTNSHGLDEENQNYSTAYDMYLLSKYAYKNKMYRKIISTKKYSAKSSLKSYIWYNRMSLINTYKKCIGGKNGYTPKAGKTLVSYAKVKDLTLGIVTLNDSDIYYNHKNLYEKYFNKYNLYKIIDNSNFTINSSFISTPIYLKKSFYYPLTITEKDNVSTFIKLFNKTKTNVVGNISIRLYDEEIGLLNIYQSKSKK